MKKLVCLAAALLLVFAPTTVQAWGQEGHEVVGTLAEAMLSAQTKTAVQAILGNVTLASVSNWADQVRNQRQETYNWHFVDIPRNEAAFSNDRDCFLPNDTHPGASTDHMNCVVDRITYFKQILADTTKTSTERQEALKFIVHFVGDIHQPFHAIGDARGGNDNHITEFGSTTCGTGKCNLHGAWDTGMIMHTGMDVNAYVQHLQELIATNHMAASGNPEDWANESHAFSQAAWLDDGGMLDDAYYNTQIQVVDKRLALAGLRLAALLEDALAVPLQTAVASRNVKLRADASTSHPAIETIHKGDQVRLLEAGKTNGFYHVQAADGKQGWVYAKYVRVQSN